MQPLPIPRAGAFRGTAVLGPRRVVESASRSESNIRSPTSYPNRLTSSISPLRKVGNAVNSFSSKYHISLSSPPPSLSLCLCLSLSLSVCLSIFRARLGGTFDTSSKVNPHKFITLNMVDASSLDVSPAKRRASPPPDSKRLAQAIGPSCSSVGPRSPDWSHQYLDEINHCSGPKVDRIGFQYIFGVDLSISKFPPIWGSMC